MNYQQLLNAIADAHAQAVGMAAAVVNQGLVLRNWLVGAYLVEYEQHGAGRARYGERLLARVSADLSRRGVRGLSVQMLERTRQVYLLYPQIRSRISPPVVRKLAAIGTPGSRGRGRKSSPLVRISEITPLPADDVLRLTWSHLIELLRIDDQLKRAFYENECLKGQWSKRQLQRQIESLLYERTGLSKNKKAVVERARRAELNETVQDMIRDPYVLEFVGLADREEYSEGELESALLDHLQRFLLELGTGFCFESRQFRITIGNKHDRVDLVFYHRRLRCHVLVDLKVRAFRHADAGQMNFYINWFKAHMMAEGDNLPVGIVLCSDKDRTEVEFATAGMDSQMFVSRYLVGLPSAEQLRQFVEADRARLTLSSDD